MGITTVYLAYNIQATTYQFIGTNLDFDPSSTIYYDTAYNLLDLLSENHFVWSFPLGTKNIYDHGIHNLFVLFQINR